MEIKQTDHSVASMNHVVRCISCGEASGELAPDFRCAHCGDLLEVDFPKWSAEAPPDPVVLKSLWRERRTSNQPLDASGVWRFREVLPELDDWACAVTLREGNTPLYDLPRCARSAGVERLQAKHQGMNPTGSFKDTGMTTAISFARQERFHWVACASTGNTSASMAAYAARGGMRSLVVIPEGKIAWGKLSQSLDYGALTCQLRTDFDGCVRVLNDVIRRYPIYLLNSVNPYRLEGQKTAAIELLEQLDWQVPDHVVVPGGNLGNNSALGKAFLEMRRLGAVDSVPKISVIQAEGANPLYRTVHEKNGKELVPVEAETLATAIRIGNPASWKKSLRVIEATGGCVEQVSEAEIALAKAEIGADGVGCEPASAVTLAGLKKLVRSGFVRPTESVVLILTGHVLKDPEYTIKFHRGDLSVPRMADDAFRALTAEQRKSPVVLDANADAVLRALEAEDKRDG
ncbi:MAG TPA: threonine synthase [Candidatus Eisenbacteria bacterium]|nr:threonine synthase [Candidatus Eisenbacteria bacterium]